MNESKYIPGTWVQAWHEYENALKDPDPNEFELAILRRKIRDAKTQYVKYVEETFNIKIDWD